MVEQAQIIRWENPPPPASHGRGTGRPPGTPSSRFNNIAEELRYRRGEWALIEEFPGRTEYGLASKINAGKLLCFAPAGDFEATSRHVLGTVRVYARYLGDEEAS